MVREAKTEAEKSDAARALALALDGLVRAPISRPSDGVVVGPCRRPRRPALRGPGDPDDRRCHLDRVPGRRRPRATSRGFGPGQFVDIEIPGQPARLRGVVHDVLPGANTADFTAPVRVDLRELFERPAPRPFRDGSHHRRRASRRDRRSRFRPRARRSRGHLPHRPRRERRRARWIDVTVGLRGAGGHRDHRAAAVARPAGRRCRTGRTARGRRGRRCGRESRALGARPRARPDGRRRAARDRRAARRERDAAGDLSVRHLPGREDHRRRRQRAGRADDAERHPAARAGAPAAARHPAGPVDDLARIDGAVGQLRLGNRHADRAAARPGRRRAAGSGPSARHASWTWRR